MKKVFLLSVMVLIILALSLGAFAFQNEPTGFGGLKWGDPPAEAWLKDFEEIYIESNYLWETAPYVRQIRIGERIFRKKEDPGTVLDDINFYTVIYHFYQDKFVQVTLCLREKWSYDNLLYVLKKRYGEPNAKEEWKTIEEWKGNHTTIDLYFLRHIWGSQVGGGKGTLIFASTNLSKRMLENRPKVVKEEEYIFEEW